MTTFERALYDDSDPLYAPLTNWTNGRCYWRPSAAYRKLGITGSVRLPGHEGDGRDLERAAEARHLTREMLGKLNATPEAPVGTWAWAIHRYRTDPYSPYQEVKANTRRTYDEDCAYWSGAIPNLRLAQTTYAKLRELQAVMQDKGRSLHFIAQKANTLRRIANYVGAAHGDKDAREVAAVMAQLTFRKGPKRTIAPTGAQILAVAAEADRRGLHRFATGLLTMWAFALRGVDVFGQWLEDEGEGGIRRPIHGKKGASERWADGLTADMFEPDAAAFAKTISKTARSLPEPVRYDLEAVPALRARYAQHLAERATGPVIFSEREGLPYTRSGRSGMFRKLARAAGLPAGIALMDTRAGALTDGSLRGLDMEALRQAAGHSDARMTARYTRGREENIVRFAKRSEG
jgi:hypothetical protein